MKKSKLFGGLSVVVGCVFIVFCFFTAFCCKWEQTINRFFDIDTSGVSSDSSSSADTQYFKTEFGDHTVSEKNQELLLAASKQQSYDEMAEGAVLLKNDNNTLPLNEGERKITVFGNNATNICYLPSGGGEGNAVSPNNMANFKDAIDNAGFKVNPTVWNAYLNSGVTRKYSAGDIMSDNIGEAPVSLYTPDVVASFDEYNDAAVIVITREQGEGADYPMDDYEGKSKLALHKNEKDMVELIVNSHKFDKIVVLVNSTSQVELGWVDEYDIGACLWIGSIGQWGALAIPDILTGKVNPSGILVDTFAADSLSAPACVNSGTRTPSFTNLGEMSSITDKESYFTYMNTMVEGIYIGYRYYETRYEDCILGNGNATDKAGATVGNAWSYADEMCYPFGTGLSYSDFEQEITSVTENNGKFTVNVKVTNKSNVPGKKGVFLYAQTPYGDYEKNNKIEKSAITLVDFGKTTKLLAENEEQTVTLEVDKYLLASYDYTTSKTYVITEGDYYFAVGEDAHDALNNILAKKGASGMIDYNGNPVAGDVKCVYKWHEDLDTATFSTSKATGKKITNRFDDCDLNYFYDNDVVKYLSRSDWKETYPVKQTAVAATAEMIRLLDGDLYTKPSNAPSLSSMNIGDTSKNIKLIELRTLDIEDPKWDEFLSQYTVKELAEYVAESSGTKLVKKFGIPGTIMVDGPLGVCSTLPFNGQKCTTWPCQGILVSTSNKALILRRGELKGEEALFKGIFAVNGPGCNLHRTPFNGRSAIYYSEDGNVTYIAAALEITGFNNKGVVAGVKHYVNNDQEFHRTGVSTFFTEQAFRETSLRAFESTLCKGMTTGCMMAFNRIGCVSDNSCYEVKAIAREEWGFAGYFQTDASQPYSNDYPTMLWSGTSLFSADAGGASTSRLTKYIDSNDDGNLYLVLKKAVKNTLFSVVNSNAMNGVDITTDITEITPWWKTVEIVLCVVFGVAMLALAAMFVLYELKILGKNADEKKEEQNDVE